MRRYFWLLILLVVARVDAVERVDVGPFSSASADGWKQKSFAGQTSYRLVKHQGSTVLDAKSVGSASAFYREMRVNLKQTPVLHWRWRKLNTLQPADENAKSGDDYVARIYVIKDGGLWFWKTRAINYVWSYQHRKGQVWDNPFAGSRAKMLSQRDAQDAEQAWFSEQRNVVDDFRELLGMEIDSIDGIAIMTDSDNSGGVARAQYGDIYFSK